MTPPDYLSKDRATEPDELIELRDQVASAIEDEIATLDLFLSQDGSHVVRSATTNGASPEGTSANDMTATAFTLYMSFDDVSAMRAASRQLTIAEIDLDLARLTDWLARQFIDTYSVGETGVLASDDVSGTDILPNNYNTSLHLVGLVAALDALDGPNEHLETYPELADLLPASAVWLEQQIGGQYRTGTQTGTGLVADNRNPYIWYWACTAASKVHSFLVRASQNPGAKLRTEDLPALSAKLRLARDAAQHRLAELIAYHHSGVEGFTDATDFLFTLAVAASGGHEQRYAGSSELIRHGLDVFLDRHVSVEGSIYPRSTAFVDNEKNAITISSAEHCAVLSAVLEDELRDFPRPLIALLKYILDRRTGRFGWGANSGDDIRRPQRPVFVTSAASNFLRGMHGLLQTEVTRTALTRAGLTARYPQERVGRLQIDRTLYDTFETQIVKPISRAARHEAALSVVLYGPPGTAKTTCAEKLAWMLGWPIVELTPALFLRDGIGRVDASADRVFEQLSLLEDTVVLFDEFEEIIRERVGATREGRLLTTSMLPRLHHIRDAGKIVFVIATNSIDAIDSAARRFGRVDMVLPVGYPSLQLRSELFENVAALFPLASETIRHLRAVGFPLEWPSTRDAIEAVPDGERGDLAEVLNQLQMVALDRFGWGHIRETVRRGNAMERDGQRIDFSVISGIVKSVAQHDRPPDVWGSQ